MFDRILPRTLTTEDRIHPAAFWLFLLLTVMTVGRSLVHIFTADGGAQSIATIPLDRMGGGGGETVVAIFAVWGLSQLLLGGVQVLALCRYRGLIPMLYLVLFVEWSGRWAIGTWKQVVTVETAPGQVGNVVIPLVALIGFGLSLRQTRRAGAPARESAAAEARVAG